MKWQGAAEIFIRVLRLFLLIWFWLCFLVFTAHQKADSDVKAMKKQAENLTTEYDRLLEEHARLQVSASTHTQIGKDILLFK